MNELMVREFGSKEVRWSNDDKLNLVDVAKCLGITRVNNQGKEYVKWNNNKDRNNICGKLNYILSREGTPTQIKEEIEEVLFEIENGDNRNNIYISNWLAKRLATECNTDIAHEFKSWLVSLDCAREEIEKGNNYINQQQFVEYQNLINGAITTIAQQTVEIVGKQTELINQQAEEYKKDREELKEFIGLRAKQVKELSHQLMIKVCSAYGKKIYASSYAWEINRDKLLNDNGYYKWEDIETKVIDGVVYQKCTTCGKWKPQNKENFYRDKRNSRGFKSQCKECKIGYYITNRETRLEHQKDYAKKIKPDLERKELKYNSKYSNLKDDK